MQNLGRDQILFEFEKKYEAEKVLYKGTRKLGSTVPRLRRWYPSMGCLDPEEEERET